ncbi:MAG: hypothetical protein L0154_08615 [Chloroflexi bacterium]|nr:hypothetical protein [Chloroflexota bacterium]
MQRNLRLSQVLPIVTLFIVVMGMVAFSLAGSGNSNAVYAQEDPTWTPVPNTSGAECDQDPDCIKYDSPGKREGCVPASGHILFVIKNGDGEFSIEFPATGGAGVTGGYVVTYDGSQVCWAANPTTKDVSNVQVWQLPDETPTDTPDVPTATPDGSATPTPDDGENNCQGGTDDWDCSSVEVEGTCINSAGVYTASFIVTNTGDPGGGDMDGPVEFRLFVNDVLVETGTLQIPGGSTASVDYEGVESDVVRLEVDQRPGHPGNSHPNAEVTLDCAPVPLMVIEGPVSEININIITIFDINIELAPDDPLLLQLQLGDIVRVQGSANFNGNIVVIVVVNVVIVEFDNIIFVNLPAGCKLTGFGNGQIRCKGSRRT